VKSGRFVCFRLLSLGGCGFLRQLVSASEPLDSTFSVNNALLTSEERVACTADLNLQRLKS